MRAHSPTSPTHRHTQLNCIIELRDRPEWASELLNRKRNHSHTEGEREREREREREQGRGRERERDTYTSAVAVNNP